MSLAGYSVWGRKEVDTTEYTQTASLYTNNELAEKVKKKKKKVHSELYQK